MKVPHFSNSFEKISSNFNYPLAKYVSDSGTILFNEGDTFEIFVADIDVVRGIDMSDNSPDRMMTGELTEVNPNGGENGTKMKLTCNDKTWTILNRVISYNFSASKAYNAPRIVQSVCRQMSDEVSQEFKSYSAVGGRVSNGRWTIDARLRSEGGFIEDTRVDGSEFPNIVISNDVKPAFEFINEVSTIEHTNDFAGDDNEDAPTQDRKMIYWLDSLNRMHWVYPQDASTNTLASNITDTDTSISLTNASLFNSYGLIYIGTEEIE